MARYIRSGAPSVPAAAGLAIRRGYMVKSIMGTENPTDTLKYN
jgi:hypothetical protein